MNELLALFTRSSKLARAAADEAMSRHGVRVGQNLLLEVLWETDGLTPGELASRLHVATPTVVKSANRMATAGLLIRKPDPADARLVRLYLTDRARSVRRAIERERDELEQRMTATLTGAEREHLRSALIKIIDQLGGSAGPAQPPGANVPGRGLPEEQGDGGTPGGIWEGPGESSQELGRPAGPAPRAGTRAQRGAGQRGAVKPGRPGGARG